MRTQYQHSLKEYCQYHQKKTKARTAMILPGLNSASLVSIGQLCDDECDVYLNKKILIAVKDKVIKLDGTRNYTDGLWYIPVQNSSITEINHTISKNIHLGLYTERETSDKANKIPYIVPTKNKYRINKELRSFNKLVNDNIFDNFFTKQQNIDAKLYGPVQRQHDNPSMSVIIHKNKTLMELAQYLHAECFSSVRSSFIKIHKK